MAKIQQYEQQVDTQGSTAKLSGPDYMAGAMQDLGQGFSKVGSVMAQYQQAKDQSEASLSEANFQIQQKALDNEFDRKTIEYTSNNVPIEQRDYKDVLDTANKAFTKIIGETPDKYKPKMQLLSNFTLNEAYPKKIEIMKLTENVAKIKSDAGVRITRAIYQDQPKVAQRVIEDLTPTFGNEWAGQQQERVVKLQFDMQKAQAGNDLVNLQDTLSLDNAQKIIKNRGMAPTYDIFGRPVLDKKGNQVKSSKYYMLGESEWQQLEKANRSQYNAVRIQIADKQNDNALSLSSIASTGQLSPLEIERQRNIGREATNVSDVGISERWYQILNKQVEKQLEESLPVDQRSKKLSAKREIKTASKEGFLPWKRTTPPFQSITELDSYLTQVNESNLSDEAKFNESVVMTREFSLRANPPLQKDFSNKVAKLYELERYARINGVAIPHGAAASDIAKKITPKTTIEQLDAYYQTAINLYQPDVNKAMQNELASKNMVKQSEQTIGSIPVVGESFNGQKVISVRKID